MAADDFRPLNLAQIYQSADASVAAAMQTNLLTLQATRMKQEFDTEDAMRALAKRSTVTDADGNVTFNRGAFTQGVYGIDPLKAMAFEKSDIEAKKAALDITKTTTDIQNTQEQIDERRLKSAADRLKLMNEASTVPYLKYKELVDKGVPDDDARKQVQPIYQGAVASLIASGIFKPEQLQKFNLPQQFDPAAAEAGMRHVLGAKDSLAQYWEERKTKETERHNRSTEAQAQASLTQAQQIHLDNLANAGNEVKQNDDGTWVVIDKKTKTAQPVRDPGTGQPLQGNKQLTESQGKALGFGQRAVEAHNIILGLEASGTKYPGQIKQAAGGVPIIGDALETGVNALPGALGGPSANQQKIEQAQRDFINAVLRPESGATITPAEFENAKKQYFTQPGDTDAVIKQKQEAREREIGTLKSMAGPGAKQFPEIRRPKEKEPPKGPEASGTVKPAAGSVNIQAPDGKTYTFPNQEAADKFKKAAGIS